MQPQPAIRRPTLVLSLVGIFVFMAAASTPALSAPPEPKPEPVGDFYRQMFLAPAAPLSVSAARGLDPVTAPDAATSPDEIQEVNYAEGWSYSVYESARTGTWDIFLRPGTGGEEVPFVASGMDEGQPRLDRNASKVVYSSDSEDGYQIWTKNVDLSAERRITSGQPSFAPNWSPDGTRIVFHRVTGVDETEVFVVNADGSGLTQLTFSPGPDGLASFSPDGSQIVFISYRTGGYRVWRMNADGSNPVQLNDTAPYSANPYYSPDGTQIGFDSTSPSDGFTGLWLMNADGSNARPVYDPSGEFDAILSGWSPSGDRMLFTYIDWILWNGNYYWESMLLKGLRVPVTTGATDTFSSLGTEMGMSWEATDKTPPNVSIQPLPATSPSDFYIFFQNQDSGGSGVGYYDLQTRPQGGTWTDWVVHGSGTASPQPFHGQGGVRYEFRIRGMDYAGNLEAWPTTPDAHTTIEALPPASRFLDPPAFINRPTIVRWTASDVGGSQVASYDRQIRYSPADPWETVSENSDSTAAELWWQPGESIDVRVRARDTAGNLEAWPEAGEPGYITVMVYSQSAYGTAHASSGAPLGGVQPNLLSGTLLAHVEDGFNGAYATYAQTEGELSLQYSKPGYGSLLPKTINQSDQLLDLWLPPGDNLVLDSDLETPLEDAGSPWQRTGTLPITSSAQPGECHTGESCALLGSAGAFFSTPFRIFAEGAEPEQISSTVDSTGRLHVVGILNGQILYRQRDAQGNWLALETPVDFDFWPFRGWTLKADSAGGVHLALGIESQVFVLSRSASGVWSEPIELVYGTNQYPMAIIPAFEIDQDDGLHVVWQCNFQPQGDVCYAYRPAGGEWQAVQVLQSQVTRNTLILHLIAGPTGALHLVWEPGAGGGNGPLVYMHRDPQGTWSQPIELVEMLFNNEPLTLALDSAGRPTLAWHLYNYPWLNLSTVWLKADGAWSEIQEKALPDDFMYSSKPTFLLDPQNRWHIFLDNDRRYAIWPRGGEIEQRGWVVPENDFSSVGATAMDRDGRIHMLYSDGTAAYYTTIFEGQLEGIGQPLGENLFSSEAQLILTAENTPHLLVKGYPSGSWEAVYYHMTLAFAETNQRGALAQTLTLPPEMSQPGLSFVYGLNGGDIGGASGIVARVTGPQGTQVVYQNRLNTDTWQHGWADLSAWAGQTVTLSIGIDQKQGEGFKFGVIDEISLGSGYGDGFMYPISGRKVPLGSRFRLVIPFGNQGGFGIQDVQLQVNIPVEFQLLGQDLPCTYTAGTLTCEIGPLAAREARSLGLELRTTEAAVLYQPAVISYSLTTSSAELELENNQQAANLVPVNELYLPAVGNWWVGD